MIQLIDFYGNSPNYKKECMKKSNCFTITYTYFLVAISSYASTDQLVLAVVFEMFKFDKTSGSVMKCLISCFLMTLVV